MLRDLRVNCAAAPAADFAAGADMATGMAVVKNYTAKEAEFASEATATDIYFVQKARIPVGRDAAMEYHSDYDKMFNEVSEGEFVVLYAYNYDDAFATDAYTLTSGDVGKYVAAGTDGKIVVATGTSKYKFTGFYDDAGHTLARIEVVEPGTN